MKRHQWPYQSVPKRISSPKTCEHNGSRLCVSVCTREHQLAYRVCHVSCTVVQRGYEPDRRTHPLSGDVYRSGGGDRAQILHTQDPWMSASHALFDCSVPMKFVRPPGVELPDTPPATGSLAFTASGARGWASSRPCTAEDSTAGCAGWWWACDMGVPVGVERGDPWELDEDRDAARGMAE